MKTSNKIILLLLVLVASLQMASRFRSASEAQPFNDSQRAVEATQRLVQNGASKPLSGHRLLSHASSSVLTQTFNVEPKQGRVIGSIFSLWITAGMVGWLAWRVGNSKIAGISAGAFVLLQDKLLGVNALILYYDQLQACFLVAGVCCLVQHMAVPKRHWLVFAGSCFGLALLAKESALLIVPPVCLGYLALRLWQTRTTPSPMTRAAAALGLIGVGLLSVLLLEALVLLSLGQAAIATIAGPTGDNVLTHWNWVNTTALVSGKHPWHVQPEEVEALRNSLGNPSSFSQIGPYLRWPFKAISNDLQQSGSFLYFAARLVYVPVFLVAFVAQRRRFGELQSRMIQALLLVATASATVPVFLVSVIYESRYFLLAYYMLIALLFGVLWQGAADQQRRRRAATWTTAALLLIVFVDFAKNEWLGMNFDFGPNRIFFSEPPS